MAMIIGFDGNSDHTIQIVKIEGHADVIEIPRLKVNSHPPVMAVKALTPALVPPQLM